MERFAVLNCFVEDFLCFNGRGFLQVLPVLTDWLFRPQRLRSGEAAERRMTIRLSLWNSPS
jgi:hypothetical protein